VCGPSLKIVSARQANGRHDKQSRLNGTNKQFSKVARSKVMKKKMELNKKMDTLFIRTNYSINEITLFEARHKHEQP